jgi:hypothetical protein
MKCRVDVDVFVKWIEKERTGRMGQKSEGVEKRDDRESPSRQ